MKVTFALVLLSLSLSLVRPAAGQTNPKFEFAKPEEVKAVEWKAQAKGGLLLTTGNSHTTNGSVGASASRKAGGNKLALEGALAYGRSTVLTPVFGDAMNPNQITELDERSVETTNSWLARGRYDRFFTTNNSGYATAQAAADKVAGKSFFGGGQVGYSRQLWKSEMHLVLAEIGYDFSYETYVAQPGKTLAAISVHSARVFVGETLKLTATTGLSGSVEALVNLNTEDKAISVSTRTPGVDPFKDTRVVGKLGVTTTLLKSLSMSLGFTLRYDQNPAPRPVPSGSPAGAGFAPTFQPFAETVDTQTEATLVYTFL
ncbi:MAG TPA: DUF481 domain-containing protein [Polyangia bacterium]|jgi:hypothetical protein|nr:DUF481 domain-containing protein [Polyangia bacterium]